ncbi:MAG: response regulator [Bacteriovoracaceae bacterium]|jgi:DNA-binding NtrC family response regulator|nr:hypothetical protein [Halobacteriovoraceae bacterium]MDP7321163.1 response regulator [Bacteriovoracaceae bacterium]
MTEHKFVLIIDDDSNFYSRVNEIFLQEDDSKYRIIHAKTRSEAVFKISNQRFDCIISEASIKRSSPDIIFNELKKMGSTNYNTPVILYSAAISPNLITNYKKLIKGAFVKPSSEEKVIAKVRKFLLR